MEESKSANMTFSAEQLNYFKFAAIVINEFTSALRKVFVYFWDHQVASKPGVPKWDDSVLVRNKFPFKEGGKSQIPFEKSYLEWDSSSLLWAILYSQTFAIPNVSGKSQTLSQSYVKPLPSGTFHDTVESPTGDKVESYALALDQLRLLRNSLLHMSSKQMMGKETFDLYITLAKDAFTALEQDSSRIDKRLTEEDFIIAGIQQLKYALQNEKRRALELKQINNYHKEIKYQSGNQVAIIGKSHCLPLADSVLELINVVKYKESGKEIHETKKHLNTVTDYLEDLKMDGQANLIVSSSKEYCIVHKVCLSGKPVIAILTPDPIFCEHDKNMEADDTDVDSTSETGKNCDSNAILFMSSQHTPSKKSPFILFWKMSVRVYEMKELHFVLSSLCENVNVLFLQPNFKKHCVEGQDFYMELTLPTDVCAKSALYAQTDFLPLLAEQKLSQSSEECSSIDSVSAVGHVSKFSYKFSSTRQAEFVFDSLVLGLDKKLPLITQQDVVISSTTAGQNAGFFQVQSCGKSSLSIVAEKDLVTVKCRTLESNCPCSSVREVLDDMLDESIEPTVRSSFKSFLQLPCEEIGDVSSSSLPSETMNLYQFASGRHLGTGLGEEPSVDVLHVVKDEAIVQLADHSDDQLQTTVESSWYILGYPSRDGYLHETSYMQASGSDEMFSSDSTCIDEQLNTSLFSEDSASSLNSFPWSPCDASCVMPEFLPKRSPSVAEEASEPAFQPLTENTHSGKHPSAGLFSDNSAESQTGYEWMPSSEEGLLSREDFPDTETRETVSLEGTLEGRDKEYKRDKQLNYTCTSVNKEQSTKDLRKIDGFPEPSFDSIIAINSLVSQLQGEIASYQNLCHELREQISQLDEKWKQSEQEKRELQGEVGRQLFLESKEKRRSENILQPSREHGGEHSMSCRASGDSHDFSPMNWRLLGGAGPLQQSERLGAPSCDSVELPEGDSCLPQEGNLVDELPKRCHNAADESSTKAQANEENKRVTEVQEVISGCSTSSGNSVNIEGDVAAFTVNTDFDDSSLQSESSSAGYTCFPDTSSGGLSSESSSSGSSLSQSSARSTVSAQHLSADSNPSSSTQGVFDGTTRALLNCHQSAVKTRVSSSESAFAVTSSGEEIQESSVSMIASIGGYESGDMSGTYAANDEKLIEISDSSVSFCNGPVKPPHLDPHLCLDDGVKSSGEEIQARSVTSFQTDEEFESGDMRGACATKDAKDEEISDYSIGLHNGAVKTSHLNHHSAANDVPDGPVCIPDRAGDSSNLEHLAGVKQDALQDGDATEKQNGPGARIDVRKDTVANQSDSNLSNQSNKWEHLGARPRDRPPKEDRSSEAVSFYSSLVDLVPQQVGGPIAHGVANAFLEKHSEDKHLHESLYYSNTEKVLAEDSSLQGASYVDGMMNLNDSNKAKLYFGDCQVASRPDPYNTSHFPVLPLTTDGGYPYHNNFSDNSGLLPGPSSSYFGGIYFQGNGNFSSNSASNALNTNLFRSDFALGTTEPRIPQDGLFTSSQRNQLLQSEFTGSGLSSDLMGDTGPQLTHSVIGPQRNSGFSDMLPSELPQTQSTLTSNLGLSPNPSGSTHTYDYRSNTSTGVPTSSSVPRANESDSGLLSGLKSSRVNQLAPVASSRDVLNTSGHRNSSSSMLNTTVDRLVAGANREGNSAGNSSSWLISDANTEGNLAQRSGQSGGSAMNRNYGTESVESTDNSLIELEQRVEEACAMVERVLREREEREEFGREIERKEREIRAERARKKREREARELQEASGWPQQQEPITGQSQWLCEHYQRHCRVRFPCCTHFYSCHRCHNNSKACDNEEAKASHATHLKCSYCQHEQEIGEDSAKCRSCGAKMSAYFCAICKHFTSIDKNPYHCEKCGICRIHKDKSFHCEVCNVCLDKRLQGKHKCRPDSGHDECCICLEDAFSGCQILPCSHKVHRECAIAMIQNGIRTCPVCRHPLYSPAPD